MSDISNCPFKQMCEDGSTCDRRFPNISINMKKPNCFKGDENTQEERE